MEAAISLKETTLNELVRRIVEAVHPLKILLFGSAARSQMGPNSDLDIPVVMPDGVHHRRGMATNRGYLLASITPIALFGSTG